jgi:hypothetical protein
MPRCKFLIVTSLPALLFRNDVFRKMFLDAVGQCVGESDVTRRPVEQDPARTDAALYEEGAASSARVVYCWWALNVMILEICIMRAFGKLWN